jgi:5'(3')-deoxyribonucleotidase
MKHLRLDLDGVLVDLHRPLLKLLGSKHTYEDINFYKFFDKNYPGWYSVVSTPEFWANLPFTPEAEKLLTGIQDVVQYADNIVICTSPIKVNGCTEGKFRWIEKNLGRAYKNIMVTTAKHIGARGDLLVDDHDENCNVFLKHGGIPLLVPAPWNTLHFVRSNGTYDVAAFVDGVRTAWES